MDDRKVDFILDSGAFSAWKLGVEIKLDEYCDWLKQNLDWIGTYVALDVIAPHSPEKAAKASWDNWRRMKDKGLDPMPVFHAYEDEKWLGKYVEAGCKYIGISGSSLPRHGGAADVFYQIVWGLLCDKQGFPVVKTHVFGEGRLEALGGYPWWSGDSASWLYMAQRTGTFIAPGMDAHVSFRHDKMDGSRSLDVATIMREDPQENLFNASEFASILKRHKIKASAFGDAARSTDGLVSYLARTYAQCLWYLEGERKIAEKCPIRFKAPDRGFFVRRMTDLPGLRFPEVKVHLVFGGNLPSMVAFAYAGARHALVSYEHIRRFHKSQWMREYTFDPLKVARTNVAFIGYYNDLMRALEDGKTVFDPKADERRRASPENPANLSTRHSKSEAAKKRKAEAASRRATLDPAALRTHERQAGAKSGIQNNPPGTRSDNGRRKLRHPDHNKGHRDSRA